MRPGARSAVRRAVRPRWPPAVVLVSLIGLSVITVGCRGAAPPPPPTPTSTSDLLEQLRIVTRSTEDSTYRRAEFGGSWADLDGDGCNTRDEVLVDTVDKSRPYRTQRQGRCTADMVAGTWTDVYTGTLMVWTDLKDPKQAERIPIDHIVSLAEAWRYGARGWSATRRLGFANDPLELTPTTRAINEARSDKDPSTWTPPPVGQCRYATRYITVKSRYDLPVDADEKAALAHLLQACPPG